jgi:hypothetical protein
MRLIAAYDSEGAYFLDTANVSVYRSWNKSLPFKYLLGLLNSKLINFWYCNNYRMPTIGLYELRSIPVKTPKKDQEERVVAGVERILKMVPTTPGGSPEIEGVLREIDEIFYEIYGLAQEDSELIREWRQ